MWVFFALTTENGLKTSEWEILGKKAWAGLNLQMNIELRGVEISLNWVYVVVAAVTTTLSGI